MKKVYSNQVNEVTAMLDEVQKRSRERTINAIDIEWLARRAEEKMADAGIPISKRPGAKASWGYRPRPANAYKFVLVGTVVTLQRNTTGWFVEDCARRNCEGTSRNCIQFTSEQEDIINANALRKAMEL